MNFKSAFYFAASAALAISMTGSLLAEAQAQNAAGMSCGDLWYARNAIYARNGYCFKTDRARAVFGAGCFPPFGELHGGDQERVHELQNWEQRKGC